MTGTQCIEILLFGRPAPPPPPFPRRAGPAVQDSDAKATCPMPGTDSQILGPGHWTIPATCLILDSDSHLPCQDIRASLSDITASDGGRLSVATSAQCSNAYFVLYSRPHSSARVHGMHVLLALRCRH